MLLRERERRKVDAPHAGHAAYGKASLYMITRRHAAVGLLRSVRPGGQQTAFRIEK